MNLTPKQDMFCREYLVDLNATQAAIRAGYSEKAAKETGYENLTKPHVQLYIAKLMTERNGRLKMDADLVLKDLIDIRNMSIDEILNDDFTVKPLNDWPDIWKRNLVSCDVSEIFEGSGDERTVVGVMKKLKWPDKQKNLEMIGRHTNVQAWKDRVAHDLHTVILHDPGRGTEEEPQTIAHY